MKIRSCLILAACSLGALAATPAAAQLSPGRSGSSSLSYMGAEEAMGELARFGRCFANKRRDGALSLIATRPSSREEAEVYRTLFRAGGMNCLQPGTSLRMPLAYIRGAIAEGLHVAGVPLPANLMLPAPASADVRNLFDAARCYAAGHRDEVRALLATKAGSKREYQAVSGMMDEFGACLPAGVKFQFDSTVIRFRLVEAQLRLAAVQEAAQ